MFVDAIKKAVRISHNSLDDEILRIEKYACAELVRAGVPQEIVEDDTNDLIKNAVITRALMELGAEKTYNNAKLSWEYQLDNLRRHDWGLSSV